MRHSILLAFCLASPALAEPPSGPWLETVRTFADQVLAEGRDIYGSKHTPFFVDGINLSTGEPIEWVYGGAWDDLPIKKRNQFELFSVQKPGDRWMLSDLANQQTLFRTLDALSILTGDLKYREAALDSTRYAFRHFQSRSGALYWGGHIAYDVRADKIVLEQHMLELKFHLPHYPLMMEASRRDALQNIEGFWDLNVVDWQTLDINRHGENLMRSPARFPWKHRYKPVPPPFPGEGLSFCGTGCDLILAAIEHHRFSGETAPLAWAQRLASRYSDGRDPNTGLVGYQFTIPREDRVRAQFGDGQTEASILAPDMIRFRYPRMAICWFYFADMLGAESGTYFNREAVRDLVAFSRHAYDSSGNQVRGVFTDGKDIPLGREGYYEGGEGVGGRLRPLKADAIYFRAFATAWRATSGSHPEIREMTRTLARKFKLAEIGVTLNDVSLYPTIKASDPHFLFGALELYRASGNKVFLTLAERIGANIISHRMRKGYFIPRPDLVNTRFDCDEPLALLHLHAALHGSTENLPTPWPSTPYFRCNFEGKGRGNDTQVIYGNRR